MLNLRRLVSVNSRVRLPYPAYDITFLFFYSIISISVLIQQRGDYMTDSEKLDLLVEKVVIIETDVQGLKQDVKDLKQDVNVLKEDVNDLKQDVNDLKQDVNVLKQDVNVLKQDVKDLKQRTTNIEADVQGLKQDVKDLKQRTTNIETDVHDLKQRTTNIETIVMDTRLMIENEIRVNIQRVAEGHLDLSRNLHEALRIDSEKEMLSVRVSVLESEMRRVKTHLEIA